MSNTTTSFLRQQFKMAHDWLEGAMGDVNTAQAHYQPQGKVNPIGGQYGHVLVAEDVWLAMIGGRKPVLASSHAGKTGLSEPPPEAGEWSAWARRVKVDLPAARAYAQAVYAATDSILGSLSDQDLEKPFDMSSMGMGMQNNAMALNLTLLNDFSHTGEISAIKGLQGSVGYKED
jgi:uncharacterized damage-inducible protein DinB